MKRLLLALLCLSSYFSLKADFGIYQKMVHPTTGQAIHLLSDIHLTKIGTNTSIQQRFDLIRAAQQCGKDSLVIVEGMADNYPGLFTVQELQSTCMHFVYQILEKLEAQTPQEKIAKMGLKGVLLKKFSLMRQYGNTLLLPITPLGWMEKECRDKGVDVHNVEVRFPRSGLSIPSSDFLTSFHDAQDPILENFYRSLPKLGYEVANIITWNFIEKTVTDLKKLSNDKFNKIPSIKIAIDTLIDVVHDNIRLARIPLVNRESEFFKENFVIDANIMQKISCNKQRKNIFVCAGALHIQHINTILYQMGYRVENTITNDFFGKEDTALALATDPTISFLQKIKNQTNEFAVMARLLVMYPIDLQAIFNLTPCVVCHPLLSMPSTTSSSSSSSSSSSGKRAEAARIPISMAELVGIPQDQAVSRAMMVTPLRARL